MTDLKTDSLKPKIEKTEFATKDVDTSVNLNEETKYKKVVETDKNQGVFDFENQILNKRAVGLSSILLTAPLIMGVCINALGHQEYMEKALNNSGLELEYVESFRPWGSLFPIGGLIAAPACSFICDKYGKKVPTILFYIMSMIGATIKVVSRYTPYRVIFLGRFFDGLASGGLMVSGVSWMFDLAPKRLHKFLKPLIQISINLGICTIAVFALEHIVGENWNFCYICQFVLSMGACINAIFLPESHIYKYTKNRNRSEVENTLKSIRGKGYDPAEVDEVLEIIDRSSSIKQMTVIEFVKQKRFSAALCVTILMNIFQQASGVNVVVAFTADLLLSKDGDATDLRRRSLYTLLILGVGVLGSFVSSPLVGKFHRKRMLLLGFATMTVCFLIISFTQSFAKFNNQMYFIVVLYSIYFFIFQFGPGPLVWFICIEIFPADAVSSAQGVSTVANWIANSCVFLIYPIVQKAINEKSIYIFAVINLLATLFILFGVVETIRKSSDQILTEYDQKYSFITRRSTAK